jgi:uncharacterized protein
MQYEWDPKKNRSNIKKHGVSFEDAIYVFSDLNSVELLEQHLFEQRYVRIGYSEMKGVLVVVYCERKEECIRIISARVATLKEQKHYEERIRF